MSIPFKRITQAEIEDKHAAEDWAKIKAMQAEEEEMGRQLDYADASFKIEFWKRWHFRKNSKQSAAIYIKEWFKDKEHTEVECELHFFLNGSLKERFKLKKWAYQLLAEGLQVSNYSGIEWFTIASHTPVKKTKAKPELQKKKANTASLKPKNLLDIL